MRSVLGIPRDREEPQPCCHPPEMLSVPGGLPRAPSVPGVAQGREGQRCSRARLSPGCALAAIPAAGGSCGAVPSPGSWAVVGLCCCGAELFWGWAVVGLSLPCFYSTWELNSHCAHSRLHPCPRAQLLALPWHSTSQTLLQGPGMTFQAQFLTFVSGPPFKLF